MIEILVLMFGGMAIGHLITGKKKLIGILEKMIMWSIFMLLFLLGIAIGRNPEIMSALGTLGLTALLISVGGIAGSISLAYVVWQMYFRDKESGHEK